ncbi:MAG: cysteine desulfurase-like protein [Acidimicrobiia bacterium]|nr:MAG: cysteine desulfurase-like protein [Acidimicrobiia bacterium]
MLAAHSPSTVFPMTIDTESVRAGFPALSRTLGGEQVAYLDGPGGTQAHKSVIEAMAGFMTRGGSNLHGPFATSRETDAVVRGAREAVADLFGSRSDEIVFGQNMTSLTYSLSRALSRTWNAGDNIVLTRLDHDANVSPWMQAADGVGAAVRFVDFDPQSGCDLDLASLDEALDERTRLVAFTNASNAVGTITPAADIVERAHQVGARTYLDAVHYAPHRPIDVTSTNTDFLVASAYKWFGPHTGCLFGTGDLLSEIDPYKLRPAPDQSPDRWETGTQSFESLAGVTAAVDYIASLGNGATRRDQIISAYGAIRVHEEMLAERFLFGIEAMPGVALFGRKTAMSRTPTFAIDIDGISPEDTARRLGDQGCFVWSGDYYAYEVMHRLNRADRGLVRIGFAHYNTMAEVDRVLSMIEALASRTRAVKSRGMRPVV